MKWTNHSETSQHNAPLTGTGVVGVVEKAVEGTAVVVVIRVKVGSVVIVRSATAVVPGSTKTNFP